MKKYKKATVVRVELAGKVGSPALNVVSSSLSLSVLGMISLEFSARSLGSCIVTISNRNQTIVKIIPGEFPALILKPKKESTKQ